MTEAKGLVPAVEPAHTLERGGERAANGSAGPSVRLRTRLEDFWPRDNIPWEALAERLLQYRTESGFFGLRSAWRIESELEWLCAALGLVAGARVLDLGCGPGQYSHGLAARGLRATGVDIAGPLIAYARAHAAEQQLDCRFERMSIFELRFEPVFDAALLVNSIINQSSVEELHRLLHGIGSALVSGGHFVCELWTLPDAAGSQARECLEKESAWSHSPWCDKPHTWLRRELSFAEQAERVTHHIISERDRPAREYWSRVNLFRRKSVEGLLEAAGFTATRWFGENVGEPALPNDERVWFWTRKR
jgi:SAM-dependent methyltransferase